MKVQIPMGRGKFKRDGASIVKYRDFLPCAVQNRLNRLIYRLGYGLGWAQGSTSSIIFARWCQCARQHSACKKRLNRTTEPIDLPFGLWTMVGRRKHKFNRILQVAPMCPHMRAHWRHLANTIEPSVCYDNAALCQITLTTY